MKFFCKISIFLIFVLCLVSLQGFRNFGNIILLVFGMWLIISYMGFPNLISRILSQKRFVVFGFFLLYQFITNMMQYSLMVCASIAVEQMFFFSPIIMYEIMKTQSRKTRRWFLLAIFFIIIADIIYSYAFMSLFSIANMRGTRELSEEFYIIAISFALCYAIALITAAVFDILKKRNEIRKLGKWTRYLFIVLGFSLLVYLVNAQFMTAILLVLFGIAFAWFYKKGRMVRLVAISTFLFVIGLASIPLVVDTLTSMGKYDALTERLIEIDNTFTGDKNAAEDLNNRRGRSAMSFETFLENPIFGVNYRLKDNVHVQNQGIGNHATWPDSLAQYGLFAILLFYFIFNSLKRQSKESGSILTMVMIVALGFLNPFLQFPQLFAAFLFVPLLYQYFLTDYIKERGANASKRIKHL